ncbi:hypothetical protein HA402_005570 [Bradysia odoriphaga]|nr:hypothetical protein HA402_005570 [Bradysia odoriphaga]
MEEKVAEENSKQEDLKSNTEIRSEKDEGESSEEAESLEEVESSKEADSSEEGDWSEEADSSQEEEFAEDIPSPLQSAVPVAIRGLREKQEYTNDDYLNEIRIIYKENPKDEPLACFYVTASFMIFRMVNYESITFLRKKCAYLLNYERLMTAHEPELTMERFSTISTMNENVKELPEKMCRKWESSALHGGSFRVFNYILSYIINHPIYVLDLHTNQWREYVLANHEQTQLHFDSVQESLPFNFTGPPFMIAEHKEQDSDGTMMGTHVAPIMHEFFCEENDRLQGILAFPFDIYIKFLQSLWPFVFAGDMPNLPAESERNDSYGKENLPADSERNDSEGKENSPAESERNNSNSEGSDK